MYVVFFGKKALHSGEKLRTVARVLTPIEDLIINDVCL